LKTGYFFTFKNELLSKIQEDDFKTVKGFFYDIPSVVETALMVPLLELSCGKIQYIPEYNYLYYGYRYDYGKESSLAKQVHMLRIK